MRSLAQTFAARLFTLLFCGIFMEESVVAQTASSPNAGSVIASNGSNQYTLSWWAQPNLYYLIQQSPDLANWQFLPMIDAGSGGLLSYGFNTTASKLFFRLKAESNPFATFSNGTSEPDGYLALNSMGPGGTTYLQQFLQNGPGKTGAPNRLGNGGNSTQPLTYTPGTGTAIGSPPVLDVVHDADGSFIPSLPSFSASRDPSNATTCKIEWNFGDEEVVSLTLEKRVGGTGLWTTLATPSNNATSFLDPGLIAGVTYEYRLVIRYESGITFTTSNVYYQVPLFDFEVGTREKSSDGFVPGVKGFIDTAPPKYYRTQTTVANGSDPYHSITSGTYHELTSYPKFSATNPEGGADPTHSGTSSATYDGSPPSTESTTEDANGIWTDDTTHSVASSLRGFVRSICSRRCRLDIRRRLDERDTDR